MVTVTCISFVFSYAGIILWVVEAQKSLLVFWWSFFFHIWQPEKMCYDWWCTCIYFTTFSSSESCQLFSMHVFNLATLCLCMICKWYTKLFQWYLHCAIYSVPRLTMLTGKLDSESLHSHRQSQVLYKHCWSWSPKWMFPTNVVLHLDCVHRGSGSLYEQSDDKAHQHRFRWFVPTTVSGRNAN